MFSRFRPGARRARRARSARPRFLFRRKPLVELLEERRMLAVITVDSAADNVTDDGLITLREAIIAANNDAVADLTEGVQQGSGADEIRFNIPGGGAQTIQPNAALPAITDVVFINGYTQPLASANTNGPGLGFNTVLTIELDGLNAAAANGLQIDAGGAGSTIRGLSIYRFDQFGVAINTGGNNTISGNFLGTNAAGTAFGNGTGIIVSFSQNNTIGGTSAADSNLISGNDNEGILITGKDASGNIIQGNYIGTHASGSGDLGNGGKGVSITDNAPNNLIGGMADGAGNAIGFNDEDGVAVITDGAIGNRISRNSIFENDELGIDLADDGDTANDAGDGDIGPNQLQNRPVFIGSATLLGDSIAFRYVVDSAVGANAAYPLEIEFFIADAFNVEGRTFLGTDTYVAGEAQMEKMAVIPAPPVLTNTSFVATATDDLGNTSEFSFPVQIELPVFLGSEPTIIRQNEEIFNDETNFYQYIAHSTGKLVVRTDFFHVLGDLGLEVRDEFGNLLASSDTSSLDQNYEEVIIPVVTQEKYFVSVIAVDVPADEPGEDDPHLYSLELENFPAPAPTGVHLDPASDTGMMNNDNVTADTTPTFFIQTDVLNFVDTNNSGAYEELSASPATEDAIEALYAEDVDEILTGVFDDDIDGGIAVEITLVNTTDGTTIVTGFADPVIEMFPDVYRFTVPDGAPLTPGVYLVSARTKVWDAQGDENGDPDQAMGRSNASPPLWITIDDSAADATVTAELLTSSDTGMFDDDNVTAKWEPAFQGVAPMNFKVRLYANGELVGQSVVGSDTSDVFVGGVGGQGGAADDGLGLWEITTEPLNEGGYDIVVEVEDAAGNAFIFDPMFNPGLNDVVDIVIDKTEPNTPFLDLLDDTGRHDNDNITKDNTPDVSMTSTDPNIALAQLLYADNLKFRIFDRFENSATEVLIYDSAVDAVADADTDPNPPEDMFTAATQLTRTLALLADGVHNLKLEVEDRAGNISHDFLLEITIDTAAPPVSFGLPDAASEIDGLAASSDTGVTTMPETFADRITSDTTPTLWGRAEADTIVQLFLDTNTNGVIDLATDVFLGGTVALPFDGNDAFPDGFWEIDSSLDLNQIVGLPKDGLRRLLVTAEDVAGNPMVLADATVDQLDIFLDTQGPQVSDVFITDVPDYDLFDPKPSINGPTPLVHSITVDFVDQPNRVAPDFIYDALKNDIATSPGNYLLVGDHVGTIAIDTVAVTASSVADGAPAATSITLTFFAPLPDDRFTLTILDNLVDPANNRLDGESNANEPQEMPTFPSGDGVPGSDFVARFTVDSRPEIGSNVATDIDIDINGNFVWDPANAQIGNDATNVDLSFTLPVENADGSIGLGGYNVHDLLFAGKFRPIDFEEGGGAGAGVPALANRYFDQLAAFGNSAEEGGIFRWIIDTNSDGVVTLGTDIKTTQPVLANFDVAGAIPVAGEFNNNPDDGDEIGLYNAGRWGLDFNHNFIIEAGEIITTTLFGAPIVGDFDGDGNDDLAVFNTNQFFFDLANNGFGSVDDTFVWGFPGVLDKPVAADMDQDGIDDVGLWVPRDSASLPQGIAEWYFLISNDPNETNRVTGQVNTLDHAFTPVPFGFDIFAEFGDERSLPIVGNFDPPVAASAPNQSTVIAGDYDGSGTVDQADYGLWKANFGSTTNLAADGNGDGVVDTADYSVWRDHLGETAPAGGSGSATSTTTETSSTLVATLSFESDSTVSEPIALQAALVESPAATSETAIIEPDSAPMLPAMTSVFTIPAGTGAGEGVVASPATADLRLETQSDDRSLLLVAADGQSARVDDAIGEYEADLAWDDELVSADALVGENAVAVAWQAWDEL